MFLCCTAVSIIDLLIRAFKLAAIIIKNGVGRFKRHVLVAQPR